MMDDFMVEVTCEEVYSEDGFHGYETYDGEDELF